MVDETWLQVAGYNAEITACGRVRLAWATRKRPGHAPIFISQDYAGRPTAKVVRDDAAKKTVSVLVARLVLMAHAGPPPFAAARVEYADRDPHNLYPANLFWAEQGPRPPSIKGPAASRGGKTRNCMTCGASFHSQHCGVRMCDKCRHSADDHMSEFAARVATRLSDLESIAVPLGLTKR